MWPPSRQAEVTARALYSYVRHLESAASLWKGCRRPENLAEQSISPISDKVTTTTPCSGYCASACSHLMMLDPILRSSRLLRKPCVNSFILAPEKPLFIRPPSCLRDQRNRAVSSSRSILALAPRCTRRSSTVCTRRCRLTKGFVRKAKPRLNASSAGKTCAQCGLHTTHVHGLFATRSDREPIAGTSSCWLPSPTASVPLCSS